MPIESRKVVQHGNVCTVSLPNGKWKKGDTLVMVHDDKKVTYMKECDLAEYLNDTI